MNMKRYLLLFLVLLFATPVHAGEFFGKFMKPKAVVEKITIVTPDDKRHEFEVELARTAQEHEIGLMNRESMPENHGMLFLFEDNAQRRFWMKNTLIPLDMLFVTETGVIHHIHHEAKPLDLTGVPSYGASKAVLEINGGMAEKLDIPEGSRILHPFFKNE